MSTIQELEEKVEQLERDILAKEQETQQLITKANKAMDFAMHAYKVDHYGIIWVWDTDEQKYVKTNMRVNSPTVCDKAIDSRHLADNSIEGRHIADDVIEGRMIKSKTIDGRSFATGVIGPEKIMDDSIPGDRYEDEALIPGKLADNAVSTRNIQSKAVTAPKIADDVKTQIIQPLIDAAVEDLQNQIDAHSDHGGFVSNQFGDDPHIAISQKRITDEVNRIWEKLEYVKIEDEKQQVFLGFTWNVTPHYFFGAPHAVEVTVLPTNPEDILEKIELYLDDSQEPFYTDTNKSSFTHTFDITETHLLKCKCQVLGRPYQRQQEIIKYEEFFIGGGTTYEDLLLNSNWNPAYSTPVGSEMRVAKDITLADDDHLIIVMGENMREAFIRADMNGIEIPLVEAAQPITVDGYNYIVFTSADTYEAGTYNIDING